MKIVYVVAVALLSAFAVNCGGDKPPQDPTSTPGPTPGMDPDAAAPDTPAPAPTTN
jgi:hypothetical protein